MSALTPQELSYICKTLLEELQIYTDNKLKLAQSQQDEKMKKWANKIYSKLKSELSFTTPPSNQQYQNQQYQNQQYQNQQYQNQQYNQPPVANDLLKQKIRNSLITEQGGIQQYFDDFDFKTGQNKPQQFIQQPLKLNEIKTENVNIETIANLNPHDAINLIESMDYSTLLKKVK